MAMPQQLVQAWTAWDQKVSGTTFAVLKAINWDVFPLSPVTKDWVAVASPTILLTSSRPTSSSWAPA